MHIKTTRELYGNDHITARLLRILPLAMASLLLTACTTTSPALESSTRIAQLLSSADRSEEDQQRDARDKPAKTLAFFGIKPGDTVLDLFAGAGYTSELLAYAAGPTGRVYAHNNEAYLRFAGPQLEGRLSRLESSTDEHSQIVRLDAELGELPLANGSVDVVVIVMAYHDAYFETDGWDVTADSLFSSIRRVLKPGGKLAIIDHVANSGSGASAAQELHRIEPAYARTDISSRGFAYSAESDALRQPNDNLDISVFDEAVRGKSDRFTYLFVKE